MLFNLTEMRFLNYFEVLWSKVWCLSMVDHFHFELISVGNNLVGSYIRWPGDLTGLRRLIYMIGFIDTIDLFSEPKEYLLKREHCMVNFGIVY